jgi:hypothetical protein
MSRNRIALALLASAVAFSAPVLAADPSRHEIYEAATTGHLDQAQKMVEQVLRNHPGSAEAHYIAAEVYAREGNFGVARSQLAQAEQIDPSDAFAKPEAVRALKAELAGTPARAATGGGFLAPVRAEPTHSFPFFPVLLLVGLIAIVWMVVRRRSAPAVYNSYPAAAGPGGYGAAGPGYGPGYGPTPMGGGGIGSGIAGGLASGLAVGAGVVAGEELAHHFLDGGERREVVQAPPDQVAPPQNGDMGGEDFGTTGADGWDDSGSSGGGDFGSSGGGGDDWT